MLRPLYKRVLTFTGERAPPISNYRKSVVTTIYSTVRMQIGLSPSRDLPETVVADPRDEFQFADAPVTGVWPGNSAGEESRSSSPSYRLPSVRRYDCLSEKTEWIYEDRSRQDTLVMDDGQTSVDVMCCLFLKRGCWVVGEAHFRIFFRAVHTWDELLYDLLVSSVRVRACVRVCV